MNEQLYPSRVATSADVRGLVNRGDVVYIAGERHVVDLDEDADFTEFMLPLTTYHLAGAKDAPQVIVMMQ